MTKAKLILIVIGALVFGPVLSAYAMMGSYYDRRYQRHMEQRSISCETYISQHGYESRYRHRFQHIRDAQEMNYVRSHGHYNKFHDAGPMIYGNKLNAYLHDGNGKRFPNQQQHYGRHNYEK